MTLLSSRLYRGLVLISALCVISTVHAAQPDVPTGVRPIGDDLSNGNYLFFEVNTATDPDGDAVTYEFELWDETMSTLLLADSLVSDTRSPVHIGFPGGFLGIWRARSFAGGEYSNWSAWYDFETSPGIAVVKAGEAFPAPPLSDFISCDDTTIVIEIKRWNYTGSKFTGVTNGFKIYSPDGATWEPVTGEWVPEVALDYDGGAFVNAINANGSGADTIGFGAFAIFAGYADEQQEVAYRIFTSVSCNDVGKTICIDTAFYPPSGHWQINLGDGGTFHPDWSGPHCFEISRCCLGRRGNIDGIIVPDGEVEISVNDLTYLVAYLFKGGEALVCEEEGNVDGISNAGLPISTNDLSYLVNYLFKGGPAPIACP